MALDERFEHDTLAGKGRVIRIRFAVHLVASALGASSPICYDGRKPMPVVVSATLTAGSLAVGATIASALVLLNARGKLPARMPLEVGVDGKLTGTGSPSTLWSFLLVPLWLALSGATIALAHGRSLSFAQEAGLNAAVVSAIIAVILNLNLVVVTRAALGRYVPPLRFLRTASRVAKVVAIFVLMCEFGLAIAAVHQIAGL